MKKKRLIVAAVISAFILVVLCVIAVVTLGNKPHQSKGVQNLVEEATESEIAESETSTEADAPKEDTQEAETEIESVQEDDALKNGIVEVDTEELAGSVTATEEETEAVSYEVISSDGEIVDYGPIFVLDGAAYERVGFKEETALSYAQTINEYANALDGIADVYDLLIPLGSGIVLPDNRRDEVRTSDQHATMDFIFNNLDDKVKKVDIYDALMSHRSEYIYFRTDHHWTARGAYYAYEKFCDAKGIEAETLDSYETEAFEGFLGTYYSDTKDKTLKAQKDTVEVFYPKSKTSFTVTPENGEVFNWRVVNDVSTYKPGTKYSTFIAGDNPYSVIENQDVADGSVCVVVKESFGNAFVPFLVDRYQTIYIIDYRYWQGSLEKLVKDTGAQDLIFANNLAMVCNKYLVGQLRKVK